MNNNKLEQAKKLALILANKLGLELSEEDLLEGANEFLKVLNQGHTFNEIKEELDKCIDNGEIKVEEFEEEEE